jgi:hypothetical protein
MNEKYQKHSVDESALVGGFVDGFALVGGFVDGFALVGGFVDGFALVGGCRWSCNYSWD